MTAQPNPEPLTLEEAAATIFQAQLAVKSLCGARDELTASIAAEYRLIEDAGYGLRAHLAKLESASARVGNFEVELKLDDKRLRVARVLVGATGEARVFPRSNTSRLVVRKAKP